MMYGSYALRKELLNTALSYADKMNVRLVFGATIGSVSRGMNFCDSDYDARFLFLNKNDESIYIPWETPESALHFKFRESDGRIRSEKTLDECLPFWEATSFFQFLKHPSFTDDVSLGLYDSFARTLFSPYTWDPYGLQQKLIPLINESFNSAWLFEFHRKNLNEFLAREKKDHRHRQHIPHHAYDIGRKRGNAVGQRVRQSPPELNQRNHGNQK